MNGKTYLKEES